MVFTWLGIALCAIVLLQCGWWMSVSLWDFRSRRRQYDVSLEWLRRQIEATESVTPPTEPPADTGAPADVANGARWQGFRTFVVTRLERETESCTSVVLRPADGKPIPAFLPGQHLTIRFAIPGQDKPVVRCYSLSGPSDSDEYRITVKRVPPPANRTDLPPGCASNHINSELKEGDRLDVKSPAGHFFLDVSTGRPIVLLAGGIGITPMLSMIETLVASGHRRPVLLVYGVRHGGDHPFRERIRQLVRSNDWLHSVVCYSSPRAGEDRLGRDYDLPGYVSVDWMRKLLPNKRCDFYLCGPPPFMQSVYEGLIDWGVSESQIRFEAFGPASIKRKRSQTKNLDGAAVTPSQPTIQVRFQPGGQTVAWSGQHESLLELAEANGIAIDSGCRSGACGTCQVRLAAGTVEYPEGVDPDVSPGECLACVARPKDNVELELP